MSEQARLADLVELTETLYRAEQAKLAEITRKENRLRTTLAKLEANRRSALALPPEDLQPLRQIGADILWQGWIGRNRTTLNQELALCLVQKAKLLSGLRRAHGKFTAAQAMLAHQVAAKQKLKDRRAVSDEQTLSLLKTHLGRD